MTFHDSKTLEIRRAYYACVSFADQQIGRVGLMLRTSSSPPCQGATRSWRAWSSREHGGHVCRRSWSPGGHNFWDKVEQRTPNISLESMQSGTNKPILRLHIVPPSCLECRELLLRWWSQDINSQPSRICKKTFSTKVTDKMVEFVDIMPTLVEAAGFPPVDKCPEYSRNVSWCRS